MTAYGFDAIDLVALIFFFVAWCTHSWVVNRSRWRVNTISYRMVAFRRQWMENMVARDLRMVDALIQNSLQQGVLFFASTSFAWSYRLFNYVIIMIGAAPEGQSRTHSRPLPNAEVESQGGVHGDIQTDVQTDIQADRRGDRRGELPSDQEAESSMQNRYADKVAQLHAIGARHFTSGLSAYFFALSALAWFLNAWAFIIATLWVSLVLYRRAFRSNFMKILSTSVLRST